MHLGLNTFSRKLIVGSDSSLKPGVLFLKNTIQGTYSWKMLWKRYYSMLVMNISCNEELSMLMELVFLNNFLIKGRTNFRYSQRKVGQNSDSQIENHTPLQDYAHTSMLALHYSDESRMSPNIMRYAMTEFLFLHSSIEALVINFYKKMHCYQKLFHCYQSILGTETF